MPIRDFYFPGSTVSRYLPPGERSWLFVVGQSGRPLLDSEVNLLEETRDYLRTILANRTSPSGWTMGQTRYDAANDFDFPVPGDVDFVPNAFYMDAQVAVVNGRPIVVDFTDTTTPGLNLIQLDAPPVNGGAPPDVKRTDFVFLEVWNAVVSTSPHATATVTVDGTPLPSPGDTIVIGGITLTAVAGAPAVDQFQIGADEFTTAANIATAINNPANSFDTLVSANSGGTDIVSLTAVAAGAAGNAITLTTTGASLVASGATFSGGADTPNKPTQDTIYRNGNVLAPGGVNLPDDIEDPSVGAETTKRVQVQYRIRVTGQAEAVNFKTQPDGFSNPNIFAQGAEAAPVATYPFVRADNTTVSGNSDATAYGFVDSGLWIAGDGSSSSATALGTADGFAYAIPIAFIFRRNDAEGTSGFDPLTNTEGALPSTHTGFVNPAVGTIPAGLSDRPDGYFADGIVRDDILDLRRHVSLAGIDLASQLQSQMEALLDGTNRTWAVDAADKNVLGAGSGDVSTRFLVCNQIGRAQASGGNPPFSGDTTRGNTIRSFDHIARRFGAQPVVERFVLGILPTYTSVSNPGAYVVQANGGYTGWAEDDEINIDLGTLNPSTLGDFDPSTSTYVSSVTNFIPPGTTITNVLLVRHDDGNYNTAVDQTVQAKTITGLGTDHVVFTLDANATQVTGGLNVAASRVVGDGGADDGSQRRIFIELEISYPYGSGLTDTPYLDDDIGLVPDATVYPSGPVLENDPTQQPGDYEVLLAPAFREGLREVKVEYVANEPGSGIGSGTLITDTIVSQSDTELRFPRRVFGSASYPVTITDTVAAQLHDVDTALTEYGSSSRLVTVSTAGGPTGSPLSGAGQTLCDIEYMAQDAVPNYGAAGFGYQIGVYYRTDAPSTVGVMAGALTTLPNTLVVEPLVTATQLWSQQAGKGTADGNGTFPFTNPGDKIPVNDSGLATFPGEWYFAGNSTISVGDFDAQTGMLNLPTFVPAVGDTYSFTSKDTDVEFRAFYGVADPTAYRPTIAAQGLSDAARHKVYFPLLAKATTDTVLYRKGEILLLVITRYAELDADNTVRFLDGTDNRACVGVYRTRNLLLVLE